MSTVSEVVIDVRGLQCPRPLLRMKKALDELESGQVLKVIATDKATKSTFPPYLRRTGDVLLKLEENGIEYHFFIQKR